MDGLFSFAGGQWHAGAIQIEEAVNMKPCVIFMLICFAFQTGCRSASSSSANVYPKSPKIRVEGPAGTQFGFSITYFDGNDIDTSASITKIPEGGVYTEDLKGGHQGVMYEVIPNSSSAKMTVILLDGTTEIQRSMATGEKETARVKAGIASLDAMPGAHR
jgi:hypothetical protein